MCSKIFDISKWIVGGDSRPLLISDSTEEYISPRTFFLISAPKGAVRVEDTDP